MDRLSNATLDRLPKSVQKPGYDRSAIATGFVHLGLAAFNLSCRKRTGKNSRYSGSHLWPPNPDHQG